MAIDDYGKLICPEVKPAVDDLFADNSFYLVGDIVVFKKEVE